MGKIKILNPLFILLLIYTNICSIHTVFSQPVKEITIQNADSILSDKRIADGANRLLGNVELIINEALMTCDSAYYYPDQRVVHAYRHVYINRGDTLKLWGDYMQYNEADSMIYVRKDVVLVNKESKLLTQKLDYNLITDVGYYPVKGHIFSGDNELVSKKGAFYTNIDMALFHDSVVIHTPEYQIFSDSLKYDTKNDISYFLDSTHIINQENHIKCERGWYNSKTRIFVINKNAFLENKGRTLTGDSIYYDDNIAFGIARSRVTINDTARNVILKGNYAEYYQEPEKAYITDSAVMLQVFEEDTLYLHADTIRLTQDSLSRRIIFAYYHVKFFKSNMQGMCDSMFYSNYDSVLQFHREPAIWSGENQITADYMELFLKNEQMDHMNMIGLAFLVSQNDTAHYNQVKGKEMEGLFTDNELYLIDVKGNGQSVYYLKDDKDNELMGVNVSICSNLKIFIRQRKPYIIKNLVNPDATLYPVEQAPRNEVILEKFKWLNDYRPLTKDDIFRWK